jgi:hypothetical protein
LKEFAIVWRCSCCAKDALDIDIVQNPEKILPNLGTQILAQQEHQNWLLNVENYARVTADGHNELNKLTNLHIKY